MSDTYFRSEERLGSCVARVVCDTKHEAKRDGNEQSVFDHVSPERRNVVQGSMSLYHGPVHHHEDLDRESVEVCADRETSLQCGCDFGTG